MKESGGQGATGGWDSSKPPKYGMFSAGEQCFSKFGFSSDEGTLVSHKGSVFVDHRQGIDR